MGFRRLGWGNPAFPGVPVGADVLLPRPMPLLSPVPLGTVR